MRSNAFSIYCLLIGTAAAAPTLVLKGESTQPYINPDLYQDNNSRLYADHDVVL